METHMLDKKNMGLRIRRAREQKHWTREQLAEKLELSVNAVADLERGKSGTRLETLVKPTTSSTGNLPRLPKPSPDC